MKKFLKRFLLFFCLPVAIFVAFVFGSTIYIQSWMPEHFDYQDHTAHFNISYNESDKSAIADIENRLESNYDRITNDLKQSLDKPVNIKIYPDLDSFHFACKLKSGLFWWINIFQKKEAWVVGTAPSSNNIMMVSPLNPGESGFTYDAILSVAVHEFTHAVSHKMIVPKEKSLMSPFAQFLLDGIAVYESDQWNLVINAQGTITNSDILKSLPESIDDGTTLLNIRYFAGYCFVKYVIDNYGFDKIIELHKKDYSGNNYDSETRALYDEWIDYLKANQN